MSEEKCIELTVAWISLDIKLNNIVIAEELLQMCPSVIFEFSSCETNASTHNKHITVYKLFHHTEHRTSSRKSSTFWLHIAADNSTLIVAILRRKLTLYYVIALWSNQDGHLFLRISSQMMIRGVQPLRRWSRSSRLQLWQKWEDRKYKGK